MTPVLLLILLGQFPIQEIVSNILNQTSCVPTGKDKKQDSGLVFPGEHWVSKDPAECGIDPKVVQELAATLGGRGCIIKEGYLVHSWGSQEKKGDWASAAKPVLSTLLFFAIKEGKVKSVDQPVADFGWELSPKDRAITFRQLGAMTSGYARPESPGKAWAYNDYAIQLYQRTLFDKVFREDPEQTLNSTKRFGALGLEDGISLRKTNRRMSASVRDFARICWLWANQGKWETDQLLPRELFLSLVKPQVTIETPNSSVTPTNDYLKIGTYGGESNHFSKAGPGLYGFNWWFNGKGRDNRDRLNWPDAPPDTMMAIGVRGNCAAIIPSLGLVLVAAEAKWGELNPGNPMGRQNQLLKKLVATKIPVLK